MAYAMIITKVEIDSFFSYFDSLFAGGEIIVSRWDIKDEQLIKVGVQKEDGKKGDAAYNDFFFM